MNDPHPALSWRMGGQDGFRLPDQSSDLTALKVLRNELTLSSDAAGHLLYSVTPALSAAAGVYTIASNAISAISFTDHPQLASFTNETVQARINAVRVTLTYIGAEQEGAGYVSIVHRIQDYPGVGVTMDALHTHALMQVRATRGVASEVAHWAEPAWANPSSSGWMAGSVPVIYVVASGLPLSKPVFRLKVEKVVEYLPKETSLSEGDVAHEPHDPGQEAIIHAVSNPRHSVWALDDAVNRVRMIANVANAAYHVAKPVLPYLEAAGRSYLIAAASRVAPMLLGA